MGHIVCTGALLTHKQGHLIEAVLVPSPTSKPEEGIVVGSMCIGVAMTDQKAFDEWLKIMQAHVLQVIKASGAGSGVGSFSFSDFMQRDEMTPETISKGAEQAASDLLTKMFKGG